MLSHLSFSYRFHRRRSMVRASTGPDLGLSRTEERSGTSHEQSIPSPVSEYHHYNELLDEASHYREILDGC